MPGKIRKYFNYEVIIIAGILLLYISLRIISWSNVSILEDHDSVSYLNTAKIIENQNWEKLDSSDTFFYPASIWLLSKLNINLEFSARLVSMLFSIVLFFMIYKTGIRITSRKSTVVGLLILSFSPFLISFSFSVLTEPSYLGLVYSGFFLFLYSIEKRNFILALFIGVIFGLSFSNRTEGIIFILFIPVIKIFYYLFWERKNYSFSCLLAWLSLFLIGFSILAVPVIIFTSNQMGTFSINGRTAWETLLKKKDGKSYEEKLQGLDYSSGETNLNFILSHPDILENQNFIENITENIKLFLLNVSKLYKEGLSSVTGIFVLIFFGIGIYYFIIGSKFKELFFISSFILIVIIPPMMLSSFMGRHIAIVIPAIILVTGIGVKEFSDTILLKIRSGRFYNFFRNKAEYIFIIVMIFLSMGWLNNALRHPSSNTEYLFENYTEPLKIVQKDIKKNKINNPIIISRKSYFPYYAEAEGIALPYTNYKKLVNYFVLNQGDYLFLEYKHIKDYPFLKNLMSNDYPDFELIYRNSKNGDRKIELYKLKKEIN